MTLPPGKTGVSYLSVLITVYQKHGSEGKVNRLYEKTPEKISGVSHLYAL